MEGLGRREDFSLGQSYAEKILRNAVHNVDKKVTGLFLSCVRGGTSTKKDGEDHTGLSCCCLSKQDDTSLEGR